MNIFPSRLVDSVNGMIGKVKVLVARQLGFNTTTSHVLELKDQDGNLIDSVPIAISNIKDLQNVLTDKENRIVSLEGLEAVVDQANQKIDFKNSNGNLLTSVNVSFLNNEGTTFVYNETTEKLELRNDADELLSEIPASSFVSNLATSLGLSGATITLKDTENTIISQITLTATNINAALGYTAADNADLLNHTENTNNPHSVTFTQLGDKPSTLSGFGIIDAYTSTYIDSTFSQIGHNHDDRYFTETESDNRFFNVTGDDVVGDSSFTGKTTFDGDTYINTQNGLNGFYLSRYAETPDEFVKMYLEDIVANFYYKNDERHASFLWTIENTDTESNGGANANTHTFEFRGDEFGAFLYLDGNPVITSANIGNYNVSEVNDLTQSVTWTTVPDAFISQSSVTQHQSALSITESQISNLGDYLPRDGSLPMTGTLNVNGTYLNVGGGAGNSGASIRASDGMVQSDAGFTKVGSSDSFMLLGGGGTKLLSDFADSVHNHDDRYVILGLNEIYTGKSINTDINDITDAFIYASSSALNKPFDINSSIISIRGLENYGFQIGGRNETFSVRGLENGIWGSWRELWHSGNSRSDSENDARYLQSFTETDPTVPQHVKDIEQTDINSWDNKVDDQDNIPRVVQISEDDLPTNFTEADILQWFRDNGVTIGDKEIIVWETIEGTVVVELQVQINTPTEGQEITGDVNLTWDILNTTGLNILTPTEGQEITGDVNLTFELI